MRAHSSPLLSKLLSQETAVPRASVSLICEKQIQQPPLPLQQAAVELRSYCGFGIMGPIHGSPSLLDVQPPRLNDFFF